MTNFRLAGCWKSVRDTFAWQDWTNALACMSTMRLAAEGGIQTGDPQISSAMSFCRFDA